MSIWMIAANNVGSGIDTRGAPGLVSSGDGSNVQTDVKVDSDVDDIGILNSD